jgi:hypothetical protein
MSVPYVPPSLSTTYVREVRRTPLRDSKRIRTVPVICSMPTMSSMRLVSPSAR